MPDSQSQVISPHQEDSLQVYVKGQREVSVVSIATVEPERIPVPSLAGYFWWAKLPVLGYMLYVGWRHLLDRDYTSFLGGINLGIHEFGHILSAFGGEVIGAFGGTFWQCAVPLGLGIYFWKQKDRFAAAFALFWLATNLFGVARYMADARALELPLVSPGGGEANHDWTFLFDHFGLLLRDTQIAGGVRFVAIVALLGAVILGAVAVGREIRFRRSSRNII